VGELDKVGEGFGAVLPVGSVLKDCFLEAIGVLESHGVNCLWLRLFIFEG